MEPDISSSDTDLFRKVVDACRVVPRAAKQFLDPKVGARWDAILRRSSTWPTSADDLTLVLLYSFRFLPGHGYGWYVGADFPELWEEFARRAIVRGADVNGSLPAYASACKEVEAGNCTMCWLSDEVHMDTLVRLGADLNRRPPPFDPCAAADRCVRNHLFWWAACRRLIPTGIRLLPHIASGRLDLPSPCVCAVDAAAAAREQDAWQACICAAQQMNGCYQESSSWCLGAYLARDLAGVVVEYLFESPLKPS